jgi:hypothetical protein
MHDPQRNGFARREALVRLGLGGLGLAAGPSWLFSLTAHAEEHAHAAPPAAAPAADWKPKALTPHQDATVTALSELIIPETDTPGAKAAYVNRFVDAVIADADEKDAEEFLRGLDWVDERCCELFGTDFVDTSPAGQNALLTIMSSEQNRALEDRLGRDFFRAMKALTILGYSTSDAGMKEIGDDGNLFFASYEGCHHPEHGGTPKQAALARKKS